MIHLNLIQKFIVLEELDLLLLPIIVGFLFSFSQFLKEINNNILEYVFFRKKL